MPYLLISMTLIFAITPSKESTWTRHHNRPFAYLCPRDSQQSICSYQSLISRCSASFRVKTGLRNSGVFKKGNPSLLSNYRPIDIALLSAVGKVCERLVYNKLYRFVTPVLSKNQSGFRKKDETAFQLTRLIQEWSHLLDDSHYIGVLFFDLRKGFWQGMAQRPVGKTIGLWRTRRSLQLVHKLPVQSTAMCPSQSIHFFFTANSCRRSPRCDP